MCCRPRGGVEAVALIDNDHVPDFVVADYRLRGGENGAEAVIRVHEKLGRKIGGVILTGEIGPEPAALATDLGLGILRKPVTPDQLLNALDDACQRALASSSHLPALSDEE